MESETGKEKKGFLGHLTPTRLLVLMVVIIFTVIGIWGSFEKSIINIEKFTKFLEGFAYFFIPLVLSVASGGAAKNFFKMKSGNVEMESKPGS